MAYDPHGLFVLSYASGFTLWHYNTADKLREVRQDGYFDAAREMFRDGDRLYVNVRRNEQVTAAQDFCVARRGVRVALVPTSTALYPALVFARSGLAA